MMKSASLKYKNSGFSAPENLPDSEELLLGDYQQIRSMMKHFLHCMSHLMVIGTIVTPKFSQWMSTQALLPSVSSLRSFKGEDAAGAQL